MTLEQLNALTKIKQEYEELRGKPFESIGTTVGLVDETIYFYGNLH